VSGPRVLSAPLGGGALTRYALSGEAPVTWYPARPRGAVEWRRRADDVARSAAGGWYEALAGAFGGAGAAGDRLARVAASGGVVVTTGQQSGFFGGPMYTLSKALSALALADALEAATGVAVAPVFWAATDDADFDEAASVWVAAAGGVACLTMPGPVTEAIPMAEVPLGDAGDALARLEAAARSAVDPAILALVRDSYHAGATVGGAYVSLLRGLLGPLGIAVLDASHPALLAAERPMLAAALRGGAELSAALAERSASLRAASFTPQVADVEGLSVVFTRVGARKLRVPLSEALAVANDPAAILSPNVLLRPVVERAVLPTVAYVGGPGELAYFAQVSVVAAALGAESPLVVPRWSCTILEPGVAEVLARLGIGQDELERPGVVESRLARAVLAPDVREALGGLRAGLERNVAALRGAVVGADALVGERVIEGAGRLLAHRVDRLERRLAAAAKRREASMMQQVEAARSALWPAGTRQERALSFVPFLARHGPALREAMSAAARRHADALIAGGVLPVDPA
jgi:bacillithiol synthase